VARRRGSITVWTIICLPLLFSILYAVAEVGHLWQARAELENAIEAAALATVQEWGEQGGGSKSIPTARRAGLAFAGANTVHRVPVRLHDRRIVPSAAWCFGTATPNGAGFDFTADPEATSKYAVVLQATVKVAKLCRPVFGGWFGESTVTATAVAFYDPADTPPRPRLIRLNPSQTLQSQDAYAVRDP
jgi:Flp pilus assembly protein TadG